MVKPYEELTFADDFVFCKAMTEYPQLCEEITAVILDRWVELLRPPGKQKAVTLTADGKAVRFQVRFEEDEKTVYDVEMQTSTQKDLHKRSRYHQGMIDLDAMSPGMSYEKLPNSIIIFICPFDPFWPNEPIYTFIKRCEENPAVYLRDETRTVFVNSKGDRSKASESLRSFLEYLEGRNEETVFTHRIDEAVQNIRENKEWRIQYMALLERDREHEEIGLAKGLAQGRSEGLIQGRREGRTEGLSGSLKNLMETMQIPLEEAMRLLRIPPADKDLYLKFLS